MWVGTSVRGAGSSGTLTRTSSPRSSTREARTSAPLTRTALPATSRAAWVRESWSWSARKRSTRSVTSDSTQKLISGMECPPGSGGLGSRGGAANVFAPERQRERYCAAAYRYVGDVERWPAQGIDADVYEVGDTL